ncbi:MAG: LytTR family DNA-binding domain-containing protein [Defluviitaleaceae bacterium]|nr:LytTR family DNA-binding domain-containing protein [Defluviitaleaceae bacterium]
MRIAVCDDEKVQVHGNVEIIQKWATHRKVGVHIDTFSSAEEFLFRWSEGQPYDLAIFDIQMRKMTGIDLAKTIRKKDNDLQIVFITGITAHVFEGYNVDALNYLIKPYAPQLFVKTLDKAHALFKQKETGSLMVSQEGRLIRIPYAEISHMEIKGHYFDIYTLTMGDFRMKKKMDEMIAMLDSSLFIRCHRSFIVNISQVASLGRLEAKLKGEQTVPLSLPNVQSVTQLFLDYHYRHSILNTDGEGS